MIKKKIPEAHTSSNGLAVAINRVSALLTYDFDANVHHPRGSSWASYRVLFVLWLAGPLPPHKAGEVIGMGKSAVSNLTKALTSKELITQTPSPSDRRSKLLSLTEKGAEYIEQTFRAQNHVEWLWASSLSETEQQILITLLNKLLESREALRIRDQRKF